MNTQAAAAAGAPVRAGRPRILGALIRRELDGVSGVILVLASAAAAAAAFQAHGPGSAGAALPVVGQIVRRFDLTVLAAMVMFLTLRTAARIDADHASGWLAPFVAAGGSRRAYGIASVAGALVAPAAVFIAAALTFAGTVAVLTGNAELLRVLPRTIGGGLLVLGTYAVCTVAIGVSLRHAAATVVAVCIVVAAPLFVLARQGLAETAPPLWTLAVQLLSPLLFVPTDPANVLRGVVYIAVGCGLAVLLAHRYTARTP